MRCKLKSFEDSKTEPDATPLGYLHLLPIELKFHILTYLERMYLVLLYHTVMVYL